MHPSRKTASRKNPESKEIRMRTNKKLFPNMFWFGATGLVATLLSTAPSCKAQEVNPTHFTATGIEDEYSVQKPQTKNVTVARTAARATPRVPTWTVAALQKEKKAPTAGRLKSFAASPTSAVDADNKRAARRVSVKKNGETPRE
jgi:hypothetical protein